MDSPIVYGPSTEAAPSSYGSSYGALATLSPMAGGYGDEAPSPDGASLVARAPDGGSIVSAESRWTPEGVRMRAGLTVLGALAAAGLGFKLGGAAGAGAGVLYFGAARNSLVLPRELETEPKKGAKTAGLVLFGLAGAGYLTYLAYQQRRSE